MKIYVCHASSFDFVKELYEPLNAIAGHSFVLPHDDGNDVHSKDVIASCDLVIAEVSFPSTGMGIELGWADAAGVPIACIHRSDTKVSDAVRHVARETAAYDGLDDLVRAIEAIVSRP
jgi:nucleoside 2-deoxyribosyltransferase